MNYLFEVSWQVCNKAGGINATIKSKSGAVSKEYKNNYILFGPLLDENPEFKESKEAEFEEIRNALNTLNLNYKIGRWNIDGAPIVILIDYKNRYDVNTLLYNNWVDYGIDSYGCQADYNEPILFGTVVGEAIVSLYKQVILQKKKKLVVHCHEWKTGATLLYVKKHMPEIATVYSAHSTTLGRCISGLGKDLVNELEKTNPYEEAKTYGLLPRYLLERAVAKEADCLTTVSNITSLEVSKVLERTPDFVIENALSMEDYEGLKDKDKRKEKREFLLNFCRKFLKKDLPENTTILLTSGKYEFSNKGYDIFLEALAKINEEIKDKSCAPVVALFLVFAGDRGVHGSVRNRIKNGVYEEGTVGITTHRLYDEAYDPIVTTCTSLGLQNNPESKVNIIFSPAYLDGADGAFDRPYLDILSGADLTVYPSFYEPWGYSVLESLFSMVPSVTTDVSGIGDWASHLGNHDGLYILSRKGKSKDEAREELKNILMEVIFKSPKDMDLLKKASVLLSKEASQDNVCSEYIKAYEKASKYVEKRYDILDTKDKKFSNLGLQGGTKPYYRSFTVVSDLPQEISKLYDIAYNFWWSWSPDARRLFNILGDKLWVHTGCNPVKMLNLLPVSIISQRCKDKEFMDLYDKVTKEYEEYMSDKSSYVKYGDTLCNQNPVAYFSMEYALHESLPIYSGGLGVLSGDHLKSASDINIPLIGVGLFYRETYFKQKIDIEGHQIEEYEKQDCSMLPIKALLDDNGNEVRISVNLPGRLLYLRIWVVNVGRVKLYLLDSDCEENQGVDRTLTARLYGGDRRMRIKQEVTLGIGGVKLLRDVLKLTPSVYHLNEGHCAFLVLERMRDYMESFGLSYQEAREAVKATTVFTTHTPVPAGNEVFDFDILRHYLSFYVQQVKISWEQFIELGCETHIGENEKFSMTVFALKLSSKANGVAKLHGKVSRNMWQNVWKGVNEEDIPIFSITNGIHVQTWLCNDLRKLYDKYLDLKWGVDDDDESKWENIEKIPDEDLWNVKLTQKQKFLDRIKVKIRNDYQRRGESEDFINKTIENLKADVLTIGFARRFATYKRSDLFLRDWNRICKILSNEERPVMILVAGKAHPADGAGKDIIQRIVNSARAPELNGRVIFLENYDTGIARLLTRGVDVWLNNPVRPHEASGTSGMKVCPNLGVNFSILDGWWDEGYSKEVGFKIDGGADNANFDHQCDLDNKALLDVLENEVIPLYYDKNEKGYSEKWLKMAKNSAKILSPYFSTQRMLKEYYDLSYEPTSERGIKLLQDNFKGLRELSDWKRQISNVFSDVYVAKVNADGITSDLMPSGGKINFTAYVGKGRLQSTELRAEVVILKRNTDKEDELKIIPLEMKKEEGGIIEYVCEYTIEVSGNYSYAVRVMPYHPLLVSSQETGLICWG